MFERLLSKFKSTGATIQQVDINQRKVLQLRTGLKYVCDTSSTDYENVALIVYQANISNTEMVLHANFFDRFHDGIDLSVMHRKDGSTVYKVRGNKVPHEMEVLLDKFLQEELEDALEQFAADENPPFSYNYGDPTLISRLYNHATNGKSNIKRHFPNRFDMIKVFKSMLDAKTNMMRKLAIYIYAQRTNKIMEAIQSKDVYVIKDVTKFCSEHSIL